MDTRNSMQTGTVTYFEATEVVGEEEQSRWKVTTKIKPAEQKLNEKPEINRCVRR